MTNSNRQNYDVIILGAGASGLFSALTAAQRGRKVLVLEKANKVGKKILMSGGGRCNFTNHFVEANNFISENPHFCKGSLTRYTQWDFIALVERYGIEYEERSHSQLFCKGSAKEILAMLISECELAGVEIRTHCEINNVRQAVSNDGASNTYQLTLKNQHSLHCQSLIVATGALSIPSLGGSGLGYSLAQQFGLGITERRAGLVPFMFSDNVMKPLCEHLAGLALPVEVSSVNQSQSKKVAPSFKENMLFTHRGISGPAMLQISNYWHPGELLNINLLPEIDTRECLLAWKQQHAKSLLRNVLSQHLAKSLVAVLQSLWWPEFSEKSLAEFSDAKLINIAKNLECWQVRPSATEGYRTAEVTLGGVDCADLSSKTLESKAHKGLYFVGEVVDVSGHLGGFNFQWAWSSGYSAGIVA